MRTTFRFWNSFKKSWVHPSNLAIWDECIHDVWDNVPDVNDYALGECNEYIEVQQYTGLKDKNGKEIYEGDIVALALEHWHNGERRCIQRIPNIEEFLDWNDDVSIKVFFEDFEIIGNIFQNPELLD